jgi:hypothetical protein
LRCRPRAGTLIGVTRAGPERRQCTWASRAARPAEWIHLESCLFGRHGLGSAPSCALSLRGRRRSRSQFATRNSLPGVHAIGLAADGRGASRSLLVGRAPAGRTRHSARASVQACVSRPFVRASDNLWWLASGRSRLAARTDRRVAAAHKLGVASRRDNRRDRRRRRRAISIVVSALVIVVAACLLFSKCQFIGAVRPPS